MRWASKGRSQPILAKYGAADRPLKIGAIEIPCYVFVMEHAFWRKGPIKRYWLVSRRRKPGARKITELMEQVAKKGIDVKGLPRAQILQFIYSAAWRNPADGYEAKFSPIFAPY